MIELNHHLDCVFEFDAHLQNQLYYLAPEVLAQNIHGYTSKSDIYMLGISICEAINGVMPFGELEPLEMLHRKLNGQVPRPVDMISLKDDQKMGLDICKWPMAEVLEGLETSSTVITLRISDFLKFWVLQIVKYI